MAGGEQGMGEAQRGDLGAGKAAGAALGGVGAAGRGRLPGQLPRGRGRCGRAPASHRGRHQMGRPEVARCSCPLSCPFLTGRNDV